jgi:hypothetical protein
MREAHLGDRSVLVLREPTPTSPPVEKHGCAAHRGERANKVDVGAIIQCDCGRRYKCRQSYQFEDEGVWVRRWLPWPPKQKDWPAS